MSYHLVFTGNPGTGKTTVARVLGGVFGALGLLEKGHLVETDRSGLVGGYVGQTAIKTQGVIQQALGGVLFIDEAYALAANQSSEDYGHEAIDTILKMMEDHRDNLIVVAAGYSEPMKTFLESNPGLKSRFTRFIDFPDYDPDELFTIFESMVQKAEYRLTPEAAARARDLLAAQYAQREAAFGNARLVRNFFERTVARNSDRLAAGANLTKEELSTVQAIDLPVGETFH
jgi:SpoVK/Ycf46/Vps4 family AAA+-type ATPase